MRLLLDTVTFLWAAASPERISPRAMSALRHPAAVRELSAISVVEVAIKRAAGKLEFRQEDFVAALNDLQARVLPFSREHALALFDLPLHHRDPFDRQIIAQALCEGAPVVTCDESFRLYKGLTVIW